MKKYLILLLILCCGVCLYAKDVEITILHTNDIHGQSHSFDYKNSVAELKDVGGAARRATLINTLRKEIKHKVFLFDIGDIAGRGEYESYYAQPEIKMMNYMKYDLMTFGNAEFKLDQFEKELTPASIDILHKRVKEAKFPVITANVYNNATGKREFTPYVIFKEKGVRIAVVGMTTLKCRTYPECVNLTFTDPFEEWGKILEEIKGKYDILVFNSHLGDLSDMALVKAVPEIDIVIEGDFHTFLFKPTVVERERGNAIVVQTGELGVMLGRLDLTVDEKTHKIKSYDYKLIPVDNTYKEDKKVNEILSHYKVKENFKPVVACWQKTWNK